MSTQFDTEQMINTEKIRLFKILVHDVGIDTCDEFFDILGERYIELDIELNREDDDGWITL